MAHIPGGLDSMDRSGPSILLKFPHRLEFTLCSKHISGVRNQLGPGFPKVFQPDISDGYRTMVFPVFMMGPNGFSSSNSADRRGPVTLHIFMDK